MKAEDVAKNIVSAWGLMYFVGAPSEEKWKHLHALITAELEKRDRAIEIYVKQLKTECYCYNVEGLICGNCIARKHADRILTPETKETKT